ncbi:MBL fold metallo-hydrolase [Pseudalkalibacillus caeni]|uniref:MBL fold metallo-hydrolase n=1 Tax=Exobacillus caeni TaxID=2574798 RepID=A0A5R9F3B5_9BACL|nr:MBL fold metallo-hydrolase [Pseudalkalibacillus caeni]TLS38087.1 MBL fold metallo-hydrolase [Pseudalkalibacillus caeni]
MEVTVLGPWGGFPAASEASAGYLIQDKGFNLLVDCGSGVLSQLQKYIAVKDLHAVIISHYHPDHVADIGVLYHGRLIESQVGEKLPPLPIYGHPYDQKGFGELSHRSYTEGKAYDPNKELHVGPFTITFQETKHPVKCYAMRITNGEKTVVYTADSAYLEAFNRLADNADLFICECNLYSDMDGSKMGHMNSTDAAKIARDAGVRTLMLTHLPHFGDLEDLVNDAKQTYDGNVMLAESGYKWE